MNNTQIELFVKTRQNMQGLVDFYNHTSEDNIWRPSWKKQPNGKFPLKYSVYWDYAKATFQIEELTSQRCPCILYFRTCETAQRFIQDNSDLLKAYFGL